MQEHLGEVWVGCLIAAMLGTPCKFDHGGVLLVVIGDIPQPPGVFQAESLDQQLPEVRPLEIVARVGVQPGMSHPAKDGVLLEPDPQHGKVVEDVKLANVETLPAFDQRRVLQVVNDLALARCGTGVQDENRKGFRLHKTPLLISLRRRGMRCRAGGDEKPHPR